MLMDLVLTLFLGFLIAEFFALRRWKGKWRLAALIPLLLVGFILIRIAFDPSQHYLLAFEALVWSSLSLAFLGLLVIIRWGIEHSQRHRAR
ncbi:MAG: hypothetical protein A4E72_00935 [Syntrophus sp. PtaU1.Bin208]|nr:MAG: hypothetical protein A4E72_00935 [Syntrophus sp. PtaU1.Bin208]